MSQVRISLGALLLSSAVCMGCSSEGGNDAALADASEDVGSVTFELRAVPANAACLRVTLGGAQVITRDFQLTAGASSAAFNLERLPLGDVAIDGEVFDVACASTNGATPSWLADSTSAYLAPGVQSRVELTFRKNNPVTANVNFVGNIEQLATSQRATYLVVDGKVWYWGALFGGNAVSFPTQVSGLPPVKRISSGATANHVCAITDTIGVWCWGSNQFGQLGQDAPLGIDSVTPVEASGAYWFDSVATGAAHSCATGKQALRCWGRNADGQLGNGTTTDSAIGYSSLSTAKDVSLGYGYTCAANSQGNVYCWGKGALGDGTTTARLAPTTSLFRPVLSVAAGGYAACALALDGTARCWGDNTNGELGDGTKSIKTTPVTVAGLSGAKQLVVGTGFGCALLTSGAVKCWGLNYSGQLGDGTGVDRLAPTTVPGLPVVRQLAAGEAHVCALSDTSEVFCWGANTYGQLGDGTRAAAFAPVKAMLP